MLDHLGSRFPRPLAAAMALAAALGCWGDDGPPRMAVDGMVIFGRAPLDAGAIQFVPEETDPRKAFHVGATIQDGRFSLPREDGPVPGRYRVLIHSVVTVPIPPEEIPPPDPNAPPGPRPTVKAVDRIPPQFNIATTLSAEIKPTWPNTLTFVLEK